MSDAPAIDHLLLGPRDPLYPALTSAFASLEPRSPQDIRNPDGAAGPLLERAMLAPEPVRAVTVTEPTALFLT